MTAVNTGIGITIFNNNVVSLTVKRSVLGWRYSGITFLIEAQQLDRGRHSRESLFFLLSIRHYWRIENINKKGCFIFFHSPPTPAPNPFSFLSFTSSSLLSSTTPAHVHPLHYNTSSQSDQCLLQRTWLNSDETLSTLLTNRTWKPHLYLFAYTAFSASLLPSDVMLFSS